VLRDGGGGGCCEGGDLMSVESYHTAC
jgi:hypothetical protein